MEGIQASAASIARETVLWLDAPAPALGEAAFIVKLALLAIAMLAAAVLLLMLVPLVARAVQRTLRALSGVHEKLFIAEAAGDDLEDESDRLEAAVAGAQTAVRAACASAADAAGNALRKRYSTLVDTLTERCASTKKRCAEAFEGDEIAFDAWIDEEEDNLRRLIIDEAVRLRIEARQSPPDQAFLAAIQTKLGPLLRKSPIEFRLRQNREELAPHADDTLFIRVMKAQRRADVRLWSLLGRAGAEIRLRRVPFRQILSRRADEELFTALQEGTEDLRKLPVKASSALQEAARILRFNLESAAAELEEPSDEDADGDTVARELVREGLERTAARLKKLLGEVEETEARFLQVSEAVADLCATRIRRDAAVADTFGERAGRIGESMAGSWREFVDHAREGLSSGAAWKNTLAAPLTAIWNSVGLTLGLKKLEVRSTQAQLEEATIDFARLRVPPLYRRLFRFEALTDEDLLDGRDAELEAFHRVKERAAKGLSGAIAVTGPIGSGKTSLMHCAVRRYFEKETLWQARIEKPLLSAGDLTAFLSAALGLEADNIDALAAAINARESQSVIFLEGGNFMFERRVGGFEAIRAFLILLSATEGKTVWVVSFSKTGWRFLDRVIGLSKRFDEVVALQGLGREQLERTLIARHEVSGYDLVFADTPGLRADARWKLRNVADPRRRQEILREEFFDELSAACGSNLHAAWYYWLRYTKVADRRRVVAQPLQAISTAVLGDLIDDELFTILYISQHDSLTPPQHARLLRTNIVDSGLTLDYLTRRRILIKHSEGAHAAYTANPILAEPIGKILKNRNLVYD